MTAPRADFACMGKQCRTDEGAPTYELPVTATRCPVCGSRRLQRLWNKAPGMLRSGSRDMQKIIDQAGGEAMDRHGALKSARLQHDKDAREIAAANGGRPVPSLAVPIDQLLTKVQGLGLKSGEARPTDSLTSPLLAGTVARRPMRPNVQAKWTPSADEMKKAGG